MRISLAQIQRGILLFWCLWLAAVLFTNLADALVALGAIPGEWRIQSGNYALIGEVTRRYATPAWLLPPLFAGVILWQALATLLFARAAHRWEGGAAEGMRRARNAFAVSLGLWASFLVIDELFMAYGVEATHMRIFVAQLVSLLFLELARERATAGAAARGDARYAEIDV